MVRQRYADVLDLDHVYRKWLFTEITGGLRYELLITVLLYQNRWSVRGPWLCSKRYCNETTRPSHSSCRLSFPTTSTGQTRTSATYDRPFRLLYGSLYLFSHWLTTTNQHSPIWRLSRTFVTSLCFFTPYFPKKKIPLVSPVIPDFKLVLIGSVDFRIDEREPTETT